MLGLLGGLIGGGKISKSILSTGLKVVDELYESDEEKKIMKDIESRKDEGNNRDN